MNHSVGKEIGNILGGGLRWRVKSKGKEGAYRAI
jgi:hypothetical protein